VDVASKLARGAGARLCPAPTLIDAVILHSQPVQSPASESRTIREDSTSLRGFDRSQARDEELAATWNLRGLDRSRRVDQGSESGE
jgi:hypothetical protein